MLGGVVYLDDDSGTWFLYYLAEDNRYGVRTAPTAESGRSRPAQPGGGDGLR